VITYLFFILWESSYITKIYCCPIKKSLLRWFQWYPYLKIDKNDDKSFVVLRRGTVSDRLRCYYLGCFNFIFNEIRMIMCKIKECFPVCKSLLMKSLTNIVWSKCSIFYFVKLWNVTYILWISWAIVCIFVVKSINHQEYVLNCHMLKSVNYLKITAFKTLFQSYLIVNKWSVWQCKNAYLFCGR